MPRDGRTPPECGARGRYLMSSIEQHLRSTDGGRTLRAGDRARETYGDGSSESRCKEGGLRGRFTARCDQMRTILDKPSGSVPGAPASGIFFRARHPVSELPVTSPDAEARERSLRASVRALGRAVVAFSGGIDSAVLLRIAVEELGDGALGVLAVGPSLPGRDRRDAVALAERIGARLELVEATEFEDPRYVRNDSDRCFWCRSALVDAVRPIAEREGAVMLYGPVLDDLQEDRPGMQAASSGGFRAPLLEAGLSKAEVRGIARRIGLPIWDKPASACLSSRVPTGTPIDPGALARIDRAEEAVAALGFRVVRVRDHGPIARLEVGVEELPRLLEGELRERVVAAVRGVGFSRVAVDLEGYRPAGLRSRLPAAPAG